MAEPRPILPFRVHFVDETLPPIDVDACDADEARAIAALRVPGALISKTKIVREKI